ncbi:MAG: T9SS type A sorting domain-containing protein [Candidatus Zixiibacteriota bacterium]|nr:MAG: T9SS type A sorting domain-containing protein [candidate division Zixibacteria bacterium]
MKNTIKRAIKLRAIFLIPATFLTLSITPSAAELYDIMGRHVLTTETDLALNESNPVVVSVGDYNSLYNHRINLPGGIYFIYDGHYKFPAQNSYLEDFSFLDVTSQFLPQEVWEDGAVQIGDINGDNLDDVIFSRYPIGFDSTEDYRLRVWMQNEDNTFTDESLSRIPAVSTPCYDFRLFDVDNDGDSDIFTSGFEAGLYYIPAALFINDGTGHFSDQSNVRLPPIAPSAIVYFSDAGDANGDDFLDLIVNIIQFPEPPGYEVFTVRLWLNDTQGNFHADTLGRIPPNNGYGFFMPFFTDIDSDFNEDIVLANMKFIVMGPSGDTIEVFSGQNACYRNTGNGFYVDETGSRMPLYDCENTRDMAFSDIDNDGDIDIAEIGFYFGQYNEQNRILLNDGSGFFSVSQNSFPPGLEGWFNDTKFGILNDDSSPDIFMIKVMPGTPDYDVLLLNDGYGMFIDSSEVLPLISDFSLSTSLFDHQIDNDKDIFIVNNGRDPMDTVRQNRLYHNMLYTPTAVDFQSINLPLSINLIEIIPNPFNSSTTISFTLSEPSVVTLRLYNIQGQRIAELLRGIRETGEHSISWDASDYPSGVYFARLEAEGFSKTAKMVLLK